MCGIAGIFRRDGAVPSQDHIQNMTRLLAHRGPDGEGYHLDNSIALGHRRLSIVDLSAAGTQPMQNEDGQYWLTYNGEVYNHLTLRDDLLSHGHQFVSQTDTEAIVHGYEQYGSEVLQRLNGMFAFAIWDAAAQTLFIARDRIGIKPLFYGLFDDVFLFGSELKAILAHPAAQRELDPIALDLYLSLNYTPAPYTLLKGVRQLLPGQYLTISREDFQPRCQTYWDVRYDQPLNIGFDDAQVEFERLLRAAVEKRLMADVPLGAFLSGGLDSSAVVAEMKAITDDVKTFSIGFGERKFNEAPYAKHVADHLRTQHFEKIVTPELATILPKVVWHGEDPLADSSMIPVYYLSQMTREQVTVALAGDGADEILAGYPTYLATQWARGLSWLPHQLIQNTVQPILNQLPTTEGKVSRGEKLSRFMAGVGLSWQEAHAVWRQIHTTAQKRALIRPDFLPDQNTLFATYKSYYDKSRSDDMLANLLYVDTRFYLPNDMLVKVDRMSMAHSLEARVPFLDHELVEFVAKLPSNYKLKGQIGKFLLRASMKNRLPQNTLQRPKEGFNIPASKWLRGELSDLMHDTLTQEHLASMGIWQEQGVRKMMNDHQQRKGDYGHQLWGILTLGIWWGQFMEGKAR